MQPPRRSARSSAESARPQCAKARRNPSAMRSTLTTNPSYAAERRRMRPHAPCAHSSGQASQILGAARILSQFPSRRMRSSHQHAGRSSSACALLLPRSLSQSARYGPVIGLTTKHNRALADDSLRPTSSLAICRASRGLATGSQRSCRLLRMPEGRKCPEAPTGAEPDQPPYRSNNPLRNPRMIHAPRHRHTTLLQVVERQRIEEVESSYARRSRRRGPAGTESHWAPPRRRRRGRCFQRPPSRWS